MIFIQVKKTHFYFILGFFSEGCPQGKGTYKWADGTVYEGDWLDGEKHGKGTFKDANGDVYEGDW